MTTDVLPLTGRRSSRVVPIASLLVCVRGLDVPMDLWDIGLHGFSIICHRPFRVGMTHRFTFSVPSTGQTVSLIAKAVHSRADNSTGTLRFVTGWVFMVGAPPEDLSAARQLIKAVTEPDEPEPDSIKDGAVL